MSAILLDSHALLWFLFDDPRLSDSPAARIADPGNDKLLSIGSLWEIAIKTQLGKLSLGMDLSRFIDEFIEGRQIDTVPIEISHLLAYHALPLHHRDPFDRLLIAQAISLDVPVLTSDARFALYEVHVVW